MYSFSEEDWNGMVTCLPGREEGRLLRLVAGEEEKETPRKSRTLLATNRYVCEICHKGFQRDQNLQLHRRGHNLPWKLKQRSTTDANKRVYICPEATCPHHDPTRALGDLTGIKKHFARKHGEKKWKCDRCSKRYAVQSDWKAHSKVCGTKEYTCDCGTIFSRRDSFVTHRAFCEALAEENNGGNNLGPSQEMPNASAPSKPLSLVSFLPVNGSFMSATALLQKAAEMGAKVSDDFVAQLRSEGYGTGLIPSVGSAHTSQMSSYWDSDGYGLRNSGLLLPPSSNSGGNKMTQDFLGLGHGTVSVGRSDDSIYLEEGKYSYHEIPYGETPFGKQMWDNYSRLH
ncbi:hypothetical protein HPP92_021213 [Vanilla planifolia]|uniref:C2H2-type domain-containing protein n=1 Tax=Vanilla planifolia TaxID=51239 RepID=A0A835Q4D7_VANPL|nr:hypothetical protein HPP92_021213 [Vanilla planifolia]